MVESFQRLSVSADSAFISSGRRPSHRASGPVKNERKFLENKMYAMTIDILDTYTKCNPKFRVVDKLPQRVLTNPSEGVANNGADNEEANLICRVHDQIICSHANYTILDLLGTGTFGQVFRCQKDGTKDVVAIKIIKNKAAYHNQGLLEIKIARLLNNTFDPRDERHIVRLLDSFEFNNHICLVFELLSISLLDILTQNQFRGLPLSVVQRFTRQIIAAMVTLEEANIIHCDLKPENILLAPPKVLPIPSSNTVKRKSNEITSDAGGARADHSGHKVEGNGASSLMGNVNANAQGLHNQNQNQTTPPPALSLSANSYSSQGQNSVAQSELATGITHAIVTPDLSSKSSSDVLDTTAAIEPAATTSSRASGGGIGESTQAPAQGQGGRLSVWSDVKVIDLGSACFEGRTMYSYIQSRFYRSPEVLLGVPYNGAIDMWSLACVCAEMYLGLPLFPGVSQHNQLTRIIEMMGYPPDSLIEGKNGSKYFSKADDCSSGSSYQSAILTDLMTSQSGEQKDIWKMPTSAPLQKYRLKTAEEYALETSTEIPILRKYLRYSKLDDVVMKCPLANKARMTPEQKKEEMLRRLCFLNFLEGLFKMNPFERWTAKQAANHPFITNSVFTGHFAPAIDPKINERKLAFMVLAQQKESRARNNLMSGIAAQERSQGTDGMHVFKPLQFRRLSEPLKTCLHGIIEKEDVAGPTLQRGQPVREVDNSCSPLKQDVYLHQSLPYSNNEFMHQQQQQFMHRQNHQQQQYTEHLQTTPEQYSAYSASTPDGVWARYTNKDQAATTVPLNDLSSRQHANAFARVNSQAAALSRNRNASSCDDLPKAMLNSSRWQGEAQEKASLGYGFPQSGKEKAGAGQFPSGSKQPGQQQQQRSYAYGDGAGGSTPHTRTVGGGGQARYDNRQPSSNRSIPQPYQIPPHLQSQYHAHDLQQQQHQQQHSSSMNLLTQQQQHQQQRGSIPSSNYPHASDAHYNVRNYTDNIDLTSGPSSDGYGGSMTDVPMMMTDFGQALMRPELDERRRLHSAQPVGLQEPYDRQRPGQTWQNQAHFQPHSRQGMPMPHQATYSQQQQQLQQLQQQQHQQHQQQYFNQGYTQHAHAHRVQNQNQKQNHNHSTRMSTSQERTSLLNEATLREQTRSRMQHAASSSGSTSAMSPSIRSGREDQGRSVSFAPNKDKDYLEAETTNYVAQLVVTSRSNPGNISGSVSPHRAGAASGGPDPPGQGPRHPYKGKGGNGVNSNGQSGVVEVTDILADWDPFFSADDFEVAELEGVVDEESSNKKGSRSIVGSGRSTSTNISDKGSTDDGDMDPDVDESEWRSAGSRGNSADVSSRTPDLPFGKKV